MAWTLPRRQTIRIRNKKCVPMRISKIPPSQSPYIRLLGLMTLLLAVGAAALLLPASPTEAQSTPPKLDLGRPYILPVAGDRVWLSWRWGDTAPPSGSTFYDSIEWKKASESTWICCVTTEGHHPWLNHWAQETFYELDAATEYDFRIQRVYVASNRNKTKGPYAQKSVTTGPAHNLPDRG